MQIVPGSMTYTYNAQTVVPLAPYEAQRISDL
jgi:hypothetical protein